MHLCFLWTVIFAYFHEMSINSKDIEVLFSMSFYYFVEFFFLSLNIFKLNTCTCADGAHVSDLGPHEALSNFVLFGCQEHSCFTNTV